MLMLRKIVFFLFLFVGLSLFAQQDYMISSYVRGNFYNRGRISTESLRASDDLIFLSVHPNKDGSLLFENPRAFQGKGETTWEGLIKSVRGKVKGTKAKIRLGASSGEDALSPELYPDIVSSTPFLIELFDVKVKDQKDKIDTTLYAYLDEYQRGPWWGAITSAPFKALGWVISLFKDKEEEGVAVKTDPFRLTKDEAAIATALSKRISVSVDKKTGVTTLSVTMQDPLISASLTDTVMRCLQNYITDYRTNKARHDLAFTEKLYKEAKDNYTVAQSKYASFVDANQNIILLSYRAEQERLQNEMNLAYNVYTQVAQQLQMAKAKVQEITPVYTVVQPASVPLRPAKPNKVMILIGFIFLAGVGSVGWILFVKDLLKGWKKQTTI